MSNNRFPLWLMKYSCPNEREQACYVYEYDIQAAISRAKRLLPDLARIVHASYVGEMIKEERVKLAKAQSAEESNHTEASGHAAQA